MIRIPAKRKFDVVNRTFGARRAFILIENGRRPRRNPVGVEHLRRSFYVPEPFSINIQAPTGLSLSRTQVTMYLNILIFVRIIGIMSFRFFV
jgi:hypothetical protein